MARSSSVHLTDVKAVAAPKLLPSAKGRQKFGYLADAQLRSHGLGHRGNDVVACAVSFAKSCFASSTRRGWRSRLTRSSLAICLSRHDGS